MHYQQNLDCYTASYTISYNSEDPGTQVQHLRHVALHAAKELAALHKRDTAPCTALLFTLSTHAVRALVSSVLMRSGVSAVQYCCLMLQ